jgi:dephospho-CoA kinase
VHVLLTGMSGTGKSSVVRELRRRGFNAYDAADDGFCDPGTDGMWRWRTKAVSELLSRCAGDTLFFAGCSEEQSQFGWDLNVLLTAPKEVIVERIATRTANPFGKSQGERDRILADLRDVEPLLRRSADVVVDTTQPLARVTDRVLLASSAAR